jgi:hypothetical protein
MQQKKTKTKSTDQHDFFCEKNAFVQHEFEMVTMIAS